MIGDYSINPDDLLVVIDSNLDEKQLVSHHIESATELYETGLQQIITEVFEIKIRVPSEDIKKNTEEDSASECDNIFNIHCWSTCIFICRMPVS